MVKKSGDEPQVEPTEPQPSTGVVAQTKSFTREELDTAMEQVRQEEMAKYQGIQKVVSKKDREIEDLRKRGYTQPSQDDKLLELMLQDRREKSSEYGGYDPLIPQLETELAARKERQAYQESQIKKQEYTDNWKEKLNTRINEAGLDPNDGQFDDVWETFDIAYSVDGKFERAEKKLDKILKSVKPEAEPKETEEELKKRLREEVKREIMLERGELETETGLPSGGNLGDAEFITQFSEGKVPMTKENIERANKIMYA